jgi:hypothetical protein
MVGHIPRRRLLVSALVGAAFAALGVALGSPHARAAPLETRDLAISASAGQAAFEPLAVGHRYRASLVQPTPSVVSSVPGWLGTQWVSHRQAKVRYETAAFLWRDLSGREVDLISGPAMTLSPAHALAQPRQRISHWNFAPYDPPTPVRRWTVAGRGALYFDATAPPPGVWTLVGSNPPEARVDHDHAFRMTAFAVHGRTVVVVVEAPAADFAAFLPVAKRLLAGLTFPDS